MNVLMTGSEYCGIDEVARLLRRAGHATLSCCDGIGGGERCAGSGDPSACPARESIDVIVAVRAHPLPHLTKREQLVDCVLLTGAPLVVAGRTVLNPYGTRAGHLLEGTDGIVRACEEAAAAKSMVVA